VTELTDVLDTEVTELTGMLDTDVTELTCVLDTEVTELTGVLDTEVIELTPNTKDNIEFVTSTMSSKHFELPVDAQGILLKL
jgi:hypothetical protein